METLEEVAKIICHTHKTPLEQANEIVKLLQERSYSEREIYVLIHERDAFWKRYKSTDSQDYISTKEWFEQFKKK